MGKGEIISNLEDGLYQVKLVYGGRNRVQTRINNLNARIADLEDRIAAESDSFQIKILTLQKTALEKSVEYLQNGMPDDKTINAWCADKTDDLSGNVGTIEIPGEDQYVNIQPGYDNNAIYNATRDGQLFPAITNSPDQAFFNKAIFPGWQKWKPTYRYGIIRSIDTGADTCSVGLVSATSSQQALGVNQGAGIALGDPDYEYQIDSDTVSGWEQFKADNPAHPLVTNTGQPQRLAADQNLINQIKAIDAEVNSQHTYATDASYRKVAEHWDIMGVGDKGDCEDFALTKADRLINDLGLSPSNMQVGLCHTNNGDYHAVLMVPTVSHGTLVLDINTFGVLTKEVIDSYGFYQWDKFLINGNEWALDVSSVLEDVPIEYMSCNSLAFSVGDEVVIKFVDQDFNQPKVIGFKSNPQECNAIFWFMLGQGVPFAGGNSSIFDILTQITKESATDEPYYNNHRTASALIGSALYFMGGGWRDLDDYPNFDDEFKKTCRKYLLNKSSGFAYGFDIQDLPDPARGSSVGFVLDGKIYCVGGSDNFVQAVTEENASIDDNDQYDPITDSWVSKNSISVGRQDGGAFSISDYAYVCGGYQIWESFVPDKMTTRPQQNTDRNDRYDAAGNSWASRQDMPGPRFWGICEAYGSLGMYAFGADESPFENDSDWIKKNTAFIYNPDSNSWKTTPAAPDEYIVDEYVSVSVTTKMPGGAAFNNFYAGIGIYFGIYKYSSETGAWTKEYDFDPDQPLFYHQRGGVVW
ncbi:MAG: transglutaminase-like cysteine peptidase [Desulfobacterales bacterium]